MVHVMLPKAMTYYIYNSCSIIWNTHLVTLSLMKYMNHQGNAAIVQLELFYLILVWNTLNTFIAFNLLSFIRIKSVKK